MNDSGIINYSEYKMRGTEAMMYVLICAAAIFTLAYIFYHNMLISFFLSVFSGFYPKIRKREIIRQRKNILKNQFRDMLYCLSASLSAGRSPELAFREAGDELALLCPDQDSFIVREALLIKGRLDTNMTIEEALYDFAERSDLEDIINFSEAFSLCKRTGGNISEVMRNAIMVITDKMETTEEIDVSVSQKKLEQKILFAIPVLMMLMMSFYAGDYTSPMYTTLTGKLSATAALILFAGAYIISKKIMEIKF